MTGSAVLIVVREAAVDPGEDEHAAVNTAQVARAPRRVTHQEALRWRLLESWDWATRSHPLTRSGARVSRARRFVSPKSGALEHPQISGNG